jgi:tetratricopeptide (TPR) repeat protein
MARPVGLRAVRSLALLVCLSRLASGQQADTAAKVYNEAAKSVLLILVRSANGQIVGQGSGFLIESGTIVTNEHVVREGSPLTDLGGARIPATVELADEADDLAIPTISAGISAEPFAGVYEEALSQAKESTVLAPEDPWAYDSEAVALIGLRRFQEAINAAKQAVRLSDGKYGLMHFHLGYAYFEIENLEFARQSYEKAAELMPKEDASAYNVALCYQRLGFSLDAARWYEEALRRNPNRTDRQEVLNRIAALRR